jgi:hypothetical protein
MVILAAPMNKQITITLWNAGGIERPAISTITDALSSSSLVFLTETWLLSPFRFPTSWPQYHTYGVPVENSYRGQQGISLLVHPDFPYHVSPLPSSSPYVFSCQVSSLLIHCLYLPPHMDDALAIEVLESLPLNPEPSQLNTLICGDFNARHIELLGDKKPNTRGAPFAEWVHSTGLRCWNSELAYGVPTLFNPRRLTSDGRPYGSVIDLMMTTESLLNPSLVIRPDPALPSDHCPVSLSFWFPSAPPPPPLHPRVVWRLSRLGRKDCKYKEYFNERVKPLQDELARHLGNIDTEPLGPDSGGVAPDIDGMATSLVDIIHSSLDDSVSRKDGKLLTQSKFWTGALQILVDLRTQARRRWLDEEDSFRKLRLWEDCELADKRFKAACKKRKRETWKEFCAKLSSGPFSETTSTIKKIRSQRRVSPQFTHHEGPTAAANAMAHHLESVFSGRNLPDTNYPSPPIPEGPHPLRSNQPRFNCPFTCDLIEDMLLHKLARRKAPGIDHLRREMLTPIRERLVPVLTSLFMLCWRWSIVPVSWCTAQVIPIYKKGDPLDAGNYRPISLTSALRKLFELCLQDHLTLTAPPLDIAQGGFRANRGATDQALNLHELCHQHAIDHYMEAPVLAFLDIKSAYDTVDRAIIWRALETHVSTPLLALLQALFDRVHIEVIIQGYSSTSFMPYTGVLQGSILSPFLYSVYINSLPTALREVRIPNTNRAFDRPPRRKYGGLWMNCLLYADDVALIGTAESMPRLLKAAEAHSRRLGYRWHPAKCVVVNPPSDRGGRPLKLYGSEIPTADSFSYLGIPINKKGKLDTQLLLDRNTQSAVSAMRVGLRPLGLASASFSRMVAAKLYAVFIRPKLEYGLSVCLLLAKQLKALEKAQNTCLRLAFGGHPKSSTAVFRHMTNLPSMTARFNMVIFKSVIRIQQLPRDTLLATIIRNSARQTFQWPRLLDSSELWEALPNVNDAAKLRMVNEAGFIRSHAIEARQLIHDAILNNPERAPPVLLSACRPTIGADPVLYLPMSLHSRSRLRRWRMGWLPGRPIACRCGAPHATRSHLIHCLNVASRLDLPADAQPNPIDHFLNRFLPVRKNRLSSPLSADELHLCKYWPTLLTIMCEIDQICLPDEEFSAASLDHESDLLLHWYRHREWPRITASSYIRILQENGIV